MQILLITLAIIVVIVAAVMAAAQMMFSRMNAVKDPVRAAANGRVFLEESNVIIAVGAHPDDLEYYTGGTLATLSSKGKKVIGVLSADKSVIQETRRREAAEAAGILGYEPVFLGHPEREYGEGLTDSERTKMRRELKALIKKYGADTVIAYDYADQGPLYHHIDHIITGEEAQAAADEAGVKNVYLYYSANPDVSVDISEVADKKTQAMAAHKSQHDKWWSGPLRLMFGWFRSDDSRDTAPGFTGPETFRKK